MIDERLERELERVARAAAPDVGALVDEVLRRRARRATVRRLQAGAVALMVTAAAFGAFVVVQARTTATTAPGGSPSSVVPQAAPPLRLGFPTCAVTSCSASPASEPGCPCSSNADCASGNCCTAAGVCG